MPLPTAAVLAAEAKLEASEPTRDAIEPTADVAEPNAPPAPDVTVPNTPSAPEVTVPKTPFAPDVTVPKPEVTSDATLVATDSAPLARLVATDATAPVTSPKMDVTSLRIWAEARGAATRLKRTTGRTILEDLFCLFLNVALVGYFGSEIEKREAMDVVGKAVLMNWMDRIGQLLKC